MLEVAVIDTAAAAAASLEPTRSRLLAELGTPGSATSLAARLGLPRQKINYHLRELERHGLIELVTERRRGNMTERVMRATAQSFVISPSALGGVAPDPRRGVNEFSARWMLAVAARLVQEVGTLLDRSARAHRPLATFTIDSELRFASAADRAGFSTELALAVATLVARYDSPQSKGGRAHRLVLALHPSITRPAETATPADTITPADREN
ncbi:MarR family transcriptional regulator [Cryobacterium algoricola]|uniref:MarR family transcriptional regulator n=1 Tax=Cryobacterium algoricola TaxID=1259183 RepID=A0ABY2II07_9MICO|nr:helix-turn-helix domain-containing protein [Cryobacterium algoricola]TFB90235.1 MarR family transcriptional regulator [Cryobacterium algoricola]